MKNSSAAAASFVSSSLSNTSNVSCQSVARPQLPVVKRVNSLQDKTKVPSAALSSSGNAAQSTQLKQGDVILQQANRTQTRLVPKPRKSATFGSKN